MKRIKGVVKRIKGVGSRFRGGGGRGAAALWKPGALVDARGAMPTPFA
jgi:hypothetical protein